MRSEWKEAPLSDVISSIIDHRGLTPKKLGGEWASSGYRALSAKNVKTGKIVQPESIRFVSEDMYHKWMPEEIDENDILITSEAPFGEIFLWDSKEKIVLSQRLFGLKISHQFDPVYVYYYMLTDSFQGDMRSRATGTTVVGLRQPELLKCKICFPEINIQKKIGSFLRNIDMKISVNDMINDNLLTQATMIYHYFFDFVGKQDMKVKMLGELARFKYGIMPKKEKLGMGVYNVFSGYKITDKYPEMMFKEPQLIIIARGVGGCGEIRYTPSDCYLTNLSIAIISETTEMDDYLYHYLRLHDTKTMNTGSAQPQITISTLEKFLIELPSMEKIIEFSDIIQPLKKIYRRNQREIRTLTELRNIILPKLMSGEIDVSAIAI